MNIKIKCGCGAEFIADASIKFNTYVYRDEIVDIERQAGLFQEKHKCCCDKKIDLRDIKPDESNDIKIITPEDDPDEMLSDDEVKALQVGLNDEDEFELDPSPATVDLDKDISKIGD